MNVLSRVDWKNAVCKAVGRWRDEHRRRLNRSRSEIQLYNAEDRMIVEDVKMNDGMMK